MLQEQRVVGLSSFQLEQLCRADHIEETMRLLCVLNHWAKARERLFFADRQGLYLVKAAILQEAYTRGLIVAKAYIDGKEGFGKELACDLAADIAAEGFLWRLEELAADPCRGQENVYERIVHQLYTRMTGKVQIVPNEVESLESSQVHAYMLERLKMLEQEARSSGQPIPHRELTELCIAPSDLLIIQDHRYYDFGDWDSWGQLDASDLRKLDPEGLSLIAFDYSSPTARYVFHLPFRIAEAFVPFERIAMLKGLPWTSRECGEYYGRAVTAVESLQQPIADILRELGADIPSLCPRQLCYKEDVLTSRCSGWYDVNEDDEDDEDEQGSLYLEHTIRLSLVAPWSEPNACPYCTAPLGSMSAHARAEHWQEEHTGQDLTTSQASWIMGCDSAKKAFRQRYPPDYRAPHERGWGTRYWKIETLKTWLNENVQDETLVQSSSC